MEILSVRYDNLTRKESIEKIVFLMAKGSKNNVFFLNADCLYKAQGDVEYRAMLNSASLVLSDGIGLMIISYLFGETMRENCNGTDISPVLMQELVKLGYKFFFLGGKEGVAERAAQKIRERIPGIKVVGTGSGFFNNSKEVVESINASNADILFVAMGAPLQEKWIHNNRGRLNPRLCIGVGALLDYLSGTVLRAPKIMRALHLEWLWRVFIDPRRMFKRYIIDGAKLFLIVFKFKFLKSGNKSGVN